MIMNFLPGVPYVHTSPALAFAEERATGTYRARSTSSSSQRCRSASQDSSRSGAGAGRPRNALTATDERLRQPECSGSSFADSCCSSRSCSGSRFSSSSGSGRCPGSPAQALLGERATPQTIHEIDHQYGLDKPIYVAVLAYLEGDRPAASRHVDHDAAFRCSPRSASASRRRVELAVAAAFFAVSIGIPLGFFAAKRHMTMFDHVSLGDLAARDLDPDLLPRADPQVHLRGAAGLATDGRADLGADQHPAPDELLSPRRAPGRQSRCVLGRDQTSDPAGGRARLDPAGDHHPDHPRSGPRRPERGLHPHGARQGTAAAHRRHATRAAQCAAAGVDDRRAAGGPAAVRGDPHRDGLRLSRESAPGCAMRSATGTTP